MVLTGLLAGLPLAHALGLASAVILVLSLAALLLIRKGAGPGALNGAAKPGSTAATNGIVAKQPKADTRQRCSIVFGTQTGTAERFAKSLRAQLDGKYGSTTAFDLVDVENYKYEEQLPKERLVLFLMATYGDGEPTDSATGVMDWLASCSQSAEAEEQFKVRGCENMGVAGFRLGRKGPLHAFRDEGGGGGMGCLLVFVPELGTVVSTHASLT